MSYSPYFIVFIFPKIRLDGTGARHGPVEVESRLGLRLGLDVFPLATSSHQNSRTPKKN